ncbi:hypothetical protein FX356_19390 [Salmonella enterica]|nr:hypothetical protein [Salmonella enterica]EDW9607603.1 hypothetical protein [Salmonella enterica subsp. houtenae serovar 50:z4,z23:-]ECJ9882967.1 hypothetical protein [Salmonella enterica]ECO9619253.1 hypothetical protein [Salmonella enterica]EEO8548666.1 hypothetical protein [Salmonella enterica]
MFRVTCIDLENGEFALYINAHYLASEDGSGEKLYPGEILERLSRLPGVTTETVERPVPESDEWNWNDVADSVFPAGISLSRTMTVAAFKQRLSEYPDDTLCCGTFWLAEDFLALDNSLEDAEIDAAMALAQHNHDANDGFNWSHLLWAINEVKRV